MSQTEFGPLKVSLRTVGEWYVRAEEHFAEPFVDVQVEGIFTDPDGAVYRMPGFYDGDDLWRVRFNPGKVGQWRVQIVSMPQDAGLALDAEFEVTPSETRGFLKATPGRGWGFEYESGEPVFIFGDTTYNLFGMSHCGGNVDGFMERRSEQGFNLLRVRVPVSPYHPPEGYSEWQTRRTWAWGGSEQSTRFDRFNLEYFATVDAVVQKAESLGMGLEMIMQAWGFEYPFNARNIFTAEYEELWMRYLIARYDAYCCVYFWTPLNEYEYYPNGDWHYKKVADLWALRIARWIKNTAPHGHIVSMHNGPRLPAFAKRFAADPTAVDAIMYQEWGSRDKDNGWLASGIEEMIQAAFEGWKGSAVFAEWGYERNEAFPLVFPGHAYCDVGHTRRGAWRGAFQGMGLIHGFENSWGPFMLLEEDQPGMVDLRHVRRFFTEVVSFHELQPAPELLSPGEYGAGERPSALATRDRDCICVYLPVGGAVHLQLSPTADGYLAEWYDTQAGTLVEGTAAAPVNDDNGIVYASPGGNDVDGHPVDWVLVLRRG